MYRRCAAELRAQQFVPVIVEETVTDAEVEIVRQLYLLLSHRGLEAHSYA